MSISNRDGERISNYRKIRTKSKSRTSLHGKAKRATGMSSLLIEIRLPKQETQSVKDAKYVLRNELNAFHVVNELTDDDNLIRYYRIKIDEHADVYQLRADIIGTLRSYLIPAGVYHTKNGRISFKGTGAGIPKRNLSRIRKLFQENEKYHVQQSLLFRLYGEKGNPFASVDFLDALKQCHQELYGHPLPNNWNQDSGTIEELLKDFEQWNDFAFKHERYIRNKLDTITDTLKTMEPGTLAYGELSADWDIWNTRMCQLAKAIPMKENGESGKPSKKDMENALKRTQKELFRYNPPSIHNRVYTPMMYAMGI